MEQRLTPSGLYPAVKAWMFDTALPWWTRHGVDHDNGGFVESFTLEGTDSGADFKRTRVTARQVYVFSHAALLGWPDGLTLARHGVEHLTRRAWRGDLGLVRRTTRAGDVLDATPDLYDYAFALFAFGWYLRASGDGVALEWAHRMLDQIEARLRPSSGEGFMNEAPAAGWRQQNPHMHLLEAALAVYEPSGDARFAELARKIVTLFQTRFYDPRSKTLAEYFDDAWRRAPGEAGRLIEPGHQFEWAWILQNARRLLGLDLAPEIRGLVEFAEAYGVDPASAATFNSVRDDGLPLDKGSRTWPNTERIKAAVALFELDGRDPAPVFASSAGLLLQRYLRTATPGLWIDAFDGAGQPVSSTAPASTLYHVFLAFAEMLRIESPLHRADLDRPAQA
jgi:mannose/cellobiose epimerase-like protein (N-acyl-D-glucosamine 2-epimerase family)